MLFSNREFVFKIDQETKMPISFEESPRMESKFLVEEFMLLANVLIAEHLHHYCHDKAIVRIHDDIKVDKKQ